MGLILKQKIFLPYSAEKYEKAISYFRDHLNKMYKDYLPKKNMTELCDKCGKPIGEREKSVLENPEGIYHDICADEILED